ncbi:CAP domain-containing protein [Streptomyces sp. NPDC058326]|uniref:CAP domain-containing protein n=1 Tax=Streptomyces sp. NPDC058326 TaxID=3346447 RepID=UPI0036EF25CF
MRYHDRPGHPRDPERAEHAPGAGPSVYSGQPIDGAAPAPVPAEDPAARANGRHRKGGGPRRLPRRPSFRTAVTAAGTAAAVLTVAAGVYLARPAAGPTADVPVVAGPVTPPGSTAGSTQVPTGRPTAGRAEPMAVSERQPERQPVRPQEQGRRQGVGTGAEAPAGKTARFVRDVVALANAERQRAGCGPLRDERHLRAAAQGHADDMSVRDYYRHESPEGRDAGDRMSRAGYAWSTWAENIHRGPKTPAQVMDDWMESSGHRANILNCSFKDIGVGVALTADGPWWVQNFGVGKH